jgi:hypothetical protein
MKTNKETYVVGLLDTNNRFSWLAGYESDPTRYYSLNMALKFSSHEKAEKAIERARKTHPGKERTYEIMTFAVAVKLTVV